MKTSNRFVVCCLAGVLVGALSACAAPPEQGPQVDVQAEAQAIRDISAEWMAYVANRDMAAILECETPREGRAAIQANIEADWAENPDFTATWSTTSVEVAASADIAWERGTWQYDPDGAGEVEGTYGEYVTLYEKTGDTWKVVLDIGVSTKPEESGGEATE
jgi:ketosteroid isomerase-like protein